MIQVNHTARQTIRHIRFALDTSPLRGYLNEVAVLDASGIGVFWADLNHRFGLYLTHVVDLSEL